MNESTTEWKLNSHDLVNSGACQSQTYFLENLEYFFIIKKESSESLFFYFHYEILAAKYDSSVVVCVQNQNNEKNYIFEISFPIKSNGESKIEMPVKLNGLLNPDEGWLHDKNLLILSIKVKLDSLTNYSKKTFKMIDCSANKYSITDTFTIVNVKKNINQRMSSSFQFGKDDEISFCFEGKSSSDRKIQLDLVFKNLTKSQKFCVYIQFQNRIREISQSVYESLSAGPEKLRHSFVFDIAESNFNESNGWIFRGSSQYQFKVANYEFSDFPKETIFLNQYSNDSSESVNNFNQQKAEFFGKSNDENEINYNAFNSKLNKENNNLFLNGLHDISELDLNNEIGLAGLQNQGVTCYLNSAIQLLFHIPAFRKVVYQMKTDEIVNNKSDEIALSLQKLFIQMQLNNKKVCSTIDFTKSFGWSQMEHDVQEFLRELIDDLEKKTKGTELDGEIAKIFRGKSRTVVKAPQVKYESVKEEFFYDLPLDVRGSANLEESLINFLKPEKLSGNNMYIVEGIGPQEAEMCTEFVEFPTVLQIHLKRFEYDQQTRMGRKINDRFEFPESIDLSRFLNKDHSKSGEKPPENVYDLYCILVHEGFAYLGHYYAFIRQMLASEDDKESGKKIWKFNDESNAWFKFNDSFVTKSSCSEAVANNYGGSYADDSNSRSSMHVDKSFSAYMIVISKSKSTINDVLSKIGYKTVSVKGEPGFLLIKNIPFLFGNHIEFRKWSIRRMTCDMKCFSDDNCCNDAIDSNKNEIDDEFKFANFNDNVDSNKNETDIEFKFVNFNDVVDSNKDDDEFEFANFCENVDENFDFNFGYGDVDDYFLIKCCSPFSFDNNKEFVVDNNALNCKFEESTKVY